MPRWLISKSIEIDASHIVEGYDGPCAKLHGHRWKIELTVEVGKLNDIGIGVDFGELKKHLESFNLDHTHLNDTIPQPTAENLARYIFDGLSRKGLKPYKVTIWETPTNKVEYFG